MKKIILILSLFGILTYSCADSILDTDPTDKVSGTAIFSDAENAMTAVNGIYRLMYSGNWGSSWEAEMEDCPHISLLST
jgi:hypothetical protein